MNISLPISLNASFDQHSIAIQIRFSDIDKINHVNNACHLNYFETARVAYFDKVFGGRNDWDKQGFVLARNEINHLHSVHLNDEIFCLTKVTVLGNKSLTLKNSVPKKQKTVTSNVLMASVFS